MSSVPAFIIHYGVLTSRFSGGSQELAEAMHETLKSKVNFKKKVTAIAESEGGMKVTYEENGKQNLGDFFSVVSTMPLPRLRFVNLTDSHLTYAQWSAIRELRYGPDVKVSSISLLIHESLDLNLDRLGFGLRSRGGITSRTVAASLEERHTQTYQSEQWFIHPTPPARTSRVSL